MPVHEGKWSTRFAAGLLVTTALAPLAVANQTHAQSLAAPRTAAAGPARDFDIPPQSLTTALAEFARQSGLRVTPSADVVRDIRTPGVQGRLAPVAALRRMLTGTGMDYAASGSAYTVQKASMVGGATMPVATVPVATTSAATTSAATTPAATTPATAGGDTLPEVRVQAQVISPYVDPAAPYKADRLSSSRFTEPVLDTPRSVTVNTREVLDDKNATALRDVARSTAGVTLGSGEGGNAFGDRFFIRGFDARNDIFVDGVRDPGVSVRDDFNTEQVEILRGPASTFAGRGTTGGAINIVTKEARFADFTRFEAQGGFSDATKRGTVDVNRQVNDKVAVRLNGMAQGADVAGRHYATDNRWGVAAAVTVRPTDDVSLKADYSHSYLWGIPDFGVPYNQVRQRPATEGDVNHANYYGIANRDFTRTTQDIGTFDAEWRVRDWLTLENKVRAGYSVLDYLGSIPENPSATGATARFNSTATRFSGFTQLNAQSRYQTTSVLADEPQATLRFETGPIRHTLVVGGDVSRETVSIDSYTGLTSEITTGSTFFTSSGAPIVSVYAPTNVLAVKPTLSLTGNPTNYGVDTRSGYALETANFNDLVILNGGIRYDDYHITAFNQTRRQNADSGLTNYNAGVVVKPLPSVSLYAAYATAANPVGSELDALSSAYGGLSPSQPSTQIFGPLRSKAYEAGIKTELLDRHMLATAAVFQTDVTNARESAPNGLPGYTAGQVVSGAAYRVRGLDFELAGKITPRWSVLAGLVFLETEVQKSIVPTNVGLRVANIANQSFNLLTKYKVTDWFEVGGQSIFASQIRGGSLLAANGGVPYGSTPRPTVLPSHWRFDVFAEAKVTQNVTTKLYISNLFNKRYYDSLYQSAQPFVQEAPGRSATLILSAKF